MPAIRAQHAHIEGLFLETDYTGPSTWNWRVIKTNNEVIATGDAAGIEEAKKYAATAAGLREDGIPWRDIGPEIEIG